MFMDCKCNKSRTRNEGIIEIGKPGDNCARLLSSPRNNDSAQREKQIRQISQILKS